MPVQVNLQQWPLVAVCTCLLRSSWHLRHKKDNVRAWTSVKPLKRCHYFMGQISVQQKMQFFCSYFNCPLGEIVCYFPKYASSGIVLAYFAFFWNINMQSTGKMCECRGFLSFHSPSNTTNSEGLFRRASVIGAKITRGKFCSPETGKEMDHTSFAWNLKLHRKACMSVPASTTISL